MYSSKNPMLEWSKKFIIRFITMVLKFIDWFLFIIRMLNAFSSFIKVFINSGSKIGFFIVIGLPISFKKMFFVKNAKNKKM